MKKEARAIDTNERKVISLSSTTSFLVLKNTIAKTIAKI